MNMMKERELEGIIIRDNLIIESLIQWVTIEHEGKSLPGLFHEMGYSIVAIYGYGQLGKMLERILDKSGIKVACIIDRVFNETKGYYVAPGPLDKEVDAVIVTNTFYYEEIREGLLKNGCKAEIRLLDELLYQL